MVQKKHTESFHTYLSGFSPDKYAVSRILAIYSAAVALADEMILDTAVSVGQKYSLERQHFYEIILQSYLFLGFPRMLDAAYHLNRFFPSPDGDSRLEKISDKEATKWYEHGIKLCQQIYGDNYLLLKERVESLAPDIFRWMIIEGYGKVLSRQVINIVDRELAIVAALMVDNRQKQLFSHMKGTLNAGASEDLLKTVIGDISHAAPDGYRSSRVILDKMGIAV